MYQFPMGKVKMLKDTHVAAAYDVSIPYGKGKGCVNDSVNNLPTYQFPMGKVKNNILYRVFIIIHRYRFVKKIYKETVLQYSLILVI